MKYAHILCIVLICWGWVKVIVTHILRDYFIGIEDDGRYDLIMSPISPWTTNDTTTITRRSENDNTPQP